MTTEDRLRFEIGECFNRLSEDELDKYEELFQNIFDQFCEEYGYEGDGPYYDAVETFMFDISSREPEDFIQIVLYHSDYGTFGWALNEIKDTDMYNYARKAMENHLREDNLDDEYIEEILNDTELPC